MKNFKKSEILSQKEDLAKELRKAREKKGITIDDASKEIKINKKYLKALEDGRYDKLPKGIYAKKFFKKYAFYLGVKNISKFNFSSIDLKKESSSTDSKNQTRSSLRQGQEKDFFPNKIIKKSNLLIVPKILKSIIIVIVVATCFVYLGFYLKRVVAPPFLDIIYPTENLTVNNDSIKIVGRTEKEADVHINGESTLPDSNGFFSKEINLKNGLNTITISAKKKYGREIIIRRQILGVK